jgi:glutathione S-transferase
VIFVPYLERMNASLAYYKGYGLRTQHPAIDRWFAALEQRSTYLGTQSDIHTHAHDLPPQMGCCLASGSAEQQRVARLIDQGPWPTDHATHPAVVETRQSPPSTAVQEALARMLRHKQRLLEVNPEGARRSAAAGLALDQALRCALTNLLRDASLPPLAPPPGTAAGLRYWRDRISVPRDMSLHAARRMRSALEATAALAGDQQGPELPRQHRRDQNPQPFLPAV